MKALPQNPETASFQNKLLEDLNFIKKYRRYPFRRMTLMPFLISGLLIASLFRFIPGAYFLAGLKTAPAFLMIIILCIFPMVVTIKRYINLIRFFEVKTPFSLSQNLFLLKKFLSENHFLVFHHPKAPEVLQIISKNIDAFGEEREVLIFIADEKRILINSHFSSSRKWFRLLSASTHEQQIIKQLKSWLRQNNMSQNHTSLVKKQQI